MNFDELPLDNELLDALDDMRFTTCTPIQEQSIPPILEGRDVLGVAQTGTGKTAAYLLPILSKLNTGNYPQDHINCLIMCPTRELAQQIDQQVEAFSFYIPVSGVAVYGGNDGMRYEQEKNGLRLGADIVTATPGRLLSHIATGNVDLSHVDFFVLDEADRMLDMGFYDDIIKIVSQLPKKRQTVLFSATMPQNIQTLAQTILTDPVEIKIAVAKPVEKIHQSAYVCYEPMKDKILIDILTKEQKDRVILFVSKKQKVKEITRMLKMRKMDAECMHSDLSQAERDEIMLRFKNRHISILVATDIVARGIDIDDIQTVINYDVPHDGEDYIHRIGRTARANREGEAITLVSPGDIVYMQRIERLMEREIEKPQLPEGCGESPEYKPARGQQGGRGGKLGKGRRGGHGRKHGKTGPSAHSAQNPHSSPQSQPSHSPQEAQPTQHKKKKRHRHGGQKPSNENNNPQPPQE